MPRRRHLFERQSEKHAKRFGRERAKSINFWFRRRYNLTPRDPRFLCLTQEEVLTEYWAHQFFDNPKVDVVEDEDFNASEIERQMADPNWDPFKDMKENPSDWTEEE